VFDLVKPVADRYLGPHNPSLLEVWNFDRQLQAIPKGRTLRIPLATPFTLRWTSDNWATVNSEDAKPTVVGIYYRDIVTTAGTAGPLMFTFYWSSTGRWEGANYQVNLT
jgi:glucoamylase